MEVIASVAEYKPGDSRRSTRHLVLVFAKWQQRVKGWLLDAVGDTLVLKDAAGKVVLPSSPEATGGA